MLTELSIIDLIKQRDFFSLKEWSNHLFPNQHEKPNSPSLSHAKNPIGSLSGGTRAEAIWGFDKTNGQPVFFFFGGIQSLSSIPNDKRSRNLKWWFYGSWCSYLASVSKVKIDLEKIVEKLKLVPKTCEIEQDVWDILLTDLSNKYEGKWYPDFSEIDIFVLFEKEEASDELTRERKEIACRYYDQHIMLNSLSNHIPWAYITSARMGNNKELASVFIDPKNYHPEQITAKYSFLWPWQRCIEVKRYCSEKGEEKPELGLTPIKTVSLVCDLRFSTIAMQLSVVPEAYAMFLDKLVANAKKIALEEGGYFDKETGDGLVAHFCSSSKSRKPPFVANCQLSKTAIKAARRIRESSLEICKEAQSHLGQGLGALHMSFGLHVEDAVWFATNNHIRAIGPSVVWASRLCSTAKPLEILISNAIYQSFIQNKDMKEITHYKKRYVEVKEFKKESKIFCYSDQIIEECEDELL